MKIRLPQMLAPGKVPAFPSLGLLEELLLHKSPFPYRALLSQQATYRQLYGKPLWLTQLAESRRTVLPQPPNVVRR